MSSPREAVYDVLLSRQQRAVKVERDDTLREDWEQYEARNETANADYSGRTGRSK